MNEPAPITAERRRLRASDFELLFEAGALAEVRRAELIDGDIHGMSPQATRHSRVKSRLAFALGARLTAMGGDLEAFVEVSVIVSADSVPEPDIVVSTYKGDRFMPADTVALIVEVSDLTLDIDVGRKAQLYADAGIPEYWIVDVNAERVVIHHQPSPSGYQQRTVKAFDARLQAVTIPLLDLGVVRLVD